MSGVRIPPRPLLDEPKRCRRVQLFISSSAFWEAIQLNVRFTSFVSCLALILAVPFDGSLLAQRRPPQIPRLAVMTFQSEEPGLGAKAAELLRERIESSYNSRDLYTIPGQDNNNVLEQSGFNPQEALPRYEEISLAGYLRADEFITGTITSENGESGPFRVEAWLVLPRGKDNTAAQPLPIIEEKRLNRAMDRLRDAIREARKQLEGERECRGKAISRDFPTAIAAGRKGIAAYPQSTLARLCVATAQYAQFVNATSAADSMSHADSSLATIQELLQYDSLSVPALRLAADLYGFRGDSARERHTLLTLIKADPSDSKLADQVINKLAASGHSKDAVPYVKAMVERSPGDPQVLRTAFLVYLDADDYASAVAIGPELIRADSTAADTLYYQRMGAAYAALEQPQRVAEIYAEATAKFPDNQSFPLLHYAALEKAGQLQQAMEVLKRVVAKSPGTTDATLLLASVYRQQKMFDSVYATLAIVTDAAPDTIKDKAAKLALAQANMAIAEAQNTRDTATVGLAIRFAQLSERLQPSGPAKYMIGTGSLLAAQMDAIKADGIKSCPLAQSASQHLSVAKTNFAAIADDEMFKAALESTKQGVTELTKAVEYQTKTFCK
jgi:tetratricopeptide (TPR) repeat protein